MQEEVKKYFTNHRCIHVTIFVVEFVHVVSETNACMYGFNIIYSLSSVIPFPARIQRNAKMMQCIDLQVTKQCTSVLAKDIKQGIQL
jgi:hypothetical protein